MVAAAGPMRLSGRSLGLRRAGRRSLALGAGYPVVLGQDPSRHRVYAIADVWVDPAHTYYTLNPSLVDGNGCFVCDLHADGVRDAHGSGVALTVDTEREPVLDHA